MTNINVTVIDTEHLEGLTELFFSDNAEIQKHITIALCRVEIWKRRGTFSQVAVRDFIRSTVSCLIQIHTDIVRPSSIYVDRIAEELISYHNLLDS